MAPRIYRASRARGALRQGEILSSVFVPFFRRESLRAGKTLVTEILVHDWAVVLTQDCDLDWDYAARFAPEGTPPPKNKDLPAVLMCEARVIDTSVRLPEFPGSDIWKRVTQNQDERYHVLDAVEPRDDRLAAGFGPLLLDFKRYFTVESSEIYQRLALRDPNPERTFRRTEVETPYREDLSDRFSSFLARVALPGKYGSK